MLRKLPLLGTIVSAALLLALAPALPAAAQPAPNAQPVGGVVTSGSAGIGHSPTTTTITQSTQRAVINWQSFNIGSQQTVRVEQPNSSAVTLMRVTGSPDPTEIAGRITSNGTVALVNAAGTLFLKGSEIDGAGLIDSAADVTNQAFMSGHFTFDGIPGPNAQIAVRGTVTVRQAGVVALLAPAVVAGGQINARRGHVFLLGADAATVDLYGDGRVTASITKQVTRAPQGASALVTVTGQVLAPQGSVQLDADIADGLLTYAVRAGGSVSVSPPPGSAGTGAGAGTISVRAVGAGVTAAGLLTAAGGAAGKQGGRIAVEGSDMVQLGSSARLDASGPAGGGVIAVGTTLAGAARRSCGAPPFARQVNVANGARLNADATGNGPGGTIGVMAASTEVFAGAATATGGASGGNGGYIALGAGGQLTDTGTADASAPAGQPGTVVIDCAPGT